MNTAEKQEYAERAAQEDRKDEQGRSQEHSRSQDDPLADLLDFVAYASVLLRQEFDSSKDLLVYKARRAAISCLFAYVGLLAFKALVFSALAALLLGSSLLLATVVPLSPAAALALTGLGTLLLIFLALLLLSTRMKKGFKRRLEEKYDRRRSTSPAKKTAPSPQHAAGTP